MDKKFLEFVAEILEVSVTEINMDTQYKVYEKWDSLKMLTLVMELEAEYDVSIAMENVGNVRTLRDLYEMVV